MKEKKDNQEKDNNNNEYINENDSENDNDNQISLLEKWNKEMNLIQEKTGIKGIFVILGLVLCIVFV